MLNFVICDDNKNFSKMMKTEIENFMMNYDQNIKFFISKVMMTVLKNL